MIKMTRRSILKASASSVVIASLPKSSNAQSTFVPPSYTPDDLKGQLTPMGSIRAGNADGTIPAWTGGYTTVPEGYQQGAPRPVPFADEQPSFVITATNVAQYADKLSAGQQALFQKYPDFTMQVFPTHRTACAPQYIYDNIYKNASNAALAEGGNGITGAYGGIPFPIPKNGAEVVWNHLLGWNGTSVSFVSDTHLVTPDGQIVLESRLNGWFQTPYYFEHGEENFNGVYSQLLAIPTAPPYQAGGSVLEIQYVNPVQIPPEAWEYLVGERRTRRAPDLEFDTPSSLTGGTLNWDEGATFQGKMIEYDFTYIGIKEIYVPYNTNKTMEAAVTDQLKKNFLNPNLVRWELHRCRVVEMTLKPGARNVDARRILYCDEDTGAAVLGDVYDANGSLWKLLHLMPIAYPDIPCVQVTQNYVGYDLHSGQYVFANHYDADTQPPWKLIPELPTSFFTPGRLAAVSGGF